MNHSIFTSVIYIFGEIPFNFVNSPRTLKIKMKAIFCFFIVVTNVVSGQLTIKVEGELPADVFETSGLIFYNDKLITHNDSGNSAQLFEIDTISRTITRTVTITNVTNIDWEDITQDDTHIYIGDIGNNRGAREDLSVYRILKTDYISSEEVTAERIDFAYEDQSSFTSDNNSDWDAEALFVCENQLIILTKQWGSGGTVAYSLPKTPGNHQAKKLDGFNVNGLVTGATYNKEMELLYIVGYSKFLDPFIVRTNKLTASSIFGGETEKFAVTSPFGQVESITHVGENNYFLTSEAFKRDTPSIDYKSLLFSLKTMDSKGKEEEEEESLILFKSVGSNALEYELKTNETIFARAIYDASGRQIRFTEAIKIEESKIDISTLNSAIYYLTFYLRSGVVSKAFIR